MWIDNNTQEPILAIGMSNGPQFGLGDVLRNIMRIDSWFNKIEAFVQQTNIQVKLLVCSHNPNSIQLFEHHPYLEAIAVDWNGSKAPYEPTANQNDWPYIPPRAFDLFTQKLPAIPGHIYLSSDEQRQLKTLTQESYILVHPFAGESNRRILSSDKYKQIIDKVIAATNLPVIVVGHTFTRNSRGHNHYISSIHITEQFEYQRPRLINLVNKTSVRLAAELARCAKLFIGCWSAFACVAWEKRIPNIILAGPGAQETFAGSKFEYRWHDKSVGINVKNVPLSKITKQIIANCAILIN